MLNITFITSNLTKLAHARHICRKYNVNILHYRKFFYGKGYEEPRIFDRDRLLKDSITDAITRWKKNVSKYEDKLFFIEDTSVKIDALSSNENEVPGVDIKYWMKKHDFTYLDTRLKEKNDRSATVTSHVVLFLTDILKMKNEISDEYIIFSSSTKGKIIEKEINLETQILYPWLDNKTFNKWFIPDGYKLPISKLSIQDADIVDFRRDAFEKMIEFLIENDIIRKNNIKDTIPLNLSFSPLYIICGETCAGKSTVGRYLVDNYGYYHIEASDFMTRRYLETHGAKSNIDKNIYASSLLKEYPSVVVDDVIDFISKKSSNTNYVITGFRTPSEVIDFRNKSPYKSFKLVYIHSDFNVRFDRWKNRHRESDNYTEDRFKKINEIQESMGVVEIGKLDYAVSYENSKESISCFLSDFEKKIMSENDKIEESFEIQNSFSELNLSLEKSILVILAIAYHKNENIYYTTTDISHLINKYFFKNKKNKNNISRYFNQYYHIYYEIKKENGKMKYKLSPTGYSEAKEIIESLRYLC